MQNASSNDWLLFTECLSRWVRSDLQACLPAHVPALARCAEWSCLVDLFFHETLHASMPREWRGSLKAVLEAVCRCWYCTQVSEEVTKYDGYAEWCVERGRDLSAWLVERVNEHVETATAEELGALFRVLRKESEERRDCTALVDFVTAVMNTPGGVDRVMSGLACLSEYSEWLSDLLAGAEGSRRGCRLAAERVRGGVRAPSQVERDGRQARARDAVLSRHETAGSRVRSSSSSSLTP